MVSNQAQPKTAFVFAGGGSFGAIQVGMLHALAAHGIVADVVFGSSVGALNGAYYAGAPTIDGIKQLEAIWRGLHRRDVFQVTWRTMLGFVRRRDFLATSEGLRGGGKGGGGWGGGGEKERQQEEYEINHPQDGSG